LLNAIPRIGYTIRQDSHQIAVKPTMRPFWHGVV
jgi:hypothetical protein